MQASEMLSPYNKIIVWGYPLYSHTASYGWEAYFKAFKHLQYSVYWFHDDDFPVDFDYSNSIFLCEGFADKKIPLNDSSCYFVWYCPSPAKYVNIVGTKKYFDVRIPMVNHVDHIHDYSFSAENTTKIGPACFIDYAKPITTRVKNQYHDYEISDYNKLYINWATNLLPSEINESDEINNQFSKIIHTPSYHTYYGMISLSLGLGIDDDFLPVKPSTLTYTFITVSN